MSKAVLVTGHSLVGEGAAYDGRGQRMYIITGGRFWSTGGEGRGLCSCKAKSKVLPSANARKAWHREHKAEVLASQSKPPMLEGAALYDGSIAVKEWGLRLPKADTPWVTSFDKTYIEHMLDRTGDGALVSRWVTDWSAEK